MFTETEKRSTVQECVTIKTGGCFIEVNISFLLIFFFWGGGSHKKHEVSEGGSFQKKMGRGGSSVIFYKRS